MIDWMYGQPAHLLVHLRAVPAGRRRLRAALPAGRGHRPRDEAQSRRGAVPHGQGRLPLVGAGPGGGPGALRALLRRPRDRAGLAGGRRRPGSGRPGALGARRRRRGRGSSSARPSPGLRSSSRVGAAGEDVDRGRTTVRSPLFVVPADGRATVRLRYWVGLSRDATRRDGLRVHLVDAAGTRLATLAAVSGTGSAARPRPGGR